MADAAQVKARVDVFYSLQSAYCYFLLDRLLGLARRGVEVVIRPVLGGVLRQPERYKDRDAMEIAYFDRDAKRCADVLGLPFANPDPSPIEWENGPGWCACPVQLRNDRLNRLYVGAAQQGRALAFLDHVGRMLWDGSTTGWDEGDAVKTAMAGAGLNAQTVLDQTSQAAATALLDANAQDMLDAGHWGVPLMVHAAEPFYGQDRFDHLLWRLKQKGILPC